MDIARLTDDDIKRLTAFRHDLHQNPELSGQEIRTTEKIREFLSTLPGCSILSLPVKAGVVARIPGTSDEIMKSLRDAYGSGTLEFGRDLNSVKIYADHCFPFWRVVSERGYLINDFYCSKEYQKKYLESEGIIITKSKNNDSYRVDDFENRRFDIARLNISVLKEGMPSIDL